MNNKLFSGIMPAMITPINEDGTLRSAAAEQVIRWELTYPIRGFYINGATGEGPVLPEKTRMEMAELSVSLLRGRGVVINHIGAPDAGETLRLARHAREIGCDAVSSVLPNYFFKYPTDRILDYYKRIADAAALPVVVYANGLMNGNPYEFMRQAVEIPGVVGVKYTIYDYYEMHRICELNGGDINVLNGPDEMLLCGLAMGADGGIGTTYNLMPDRFCALYDAFRAGDIRRAQELQFSVNHVIAALRPYTSIPAVKAYFSMRGIDAGHTAYPGRILSAEEQTAFRAALEENGIPCDPIGI